MQISRIREGEKRSRLQPGENRSREETMVRVATFFGMSFGAFLFWQSMDKLHVWIALHQDEKVSLSLSPLPHGTSSPDARQCAARPFICRKWAGDSSSTNLNPIQRTLAHCTVQRVRGREFLQPHPLRKMLRFFLKGIGVSLRRFEILD
jgi:hypothetical protein